MSNEERRDSLADQAAAWIPPWERPTPTPEPTDPAEQAAVAPAPGEEAEQAVAVAAPADEAERAEAVAMPAEESERAEAVPAPAEEAEGAAAVAAPAEEVERAAALATPAEEAQPAEAAPTPVGDAELTESVPTAGEGREAGGAPRQREEPAEESEAADVPKKQGAGRRRATPAPEPAPELDDAELRGALEAILLVVDEPVSELTLAQVLEQSPERVGRMLDDIAAGYTVAGHGFELRRAAGGWRLYTRPEYATYVERFVLDGQSVRLTQAALETLAVIAYKQPVTRSRISAIRGVNCDGVIRTLVSRGLVEECGTEAESGAFLYRTTTMFLEKLGLNSVDDLPPLAPFLPDDVEELADATR